MDRERPRKQWTLVTHEEYFHSLRRVVSDRDRYALVTAIWERLQKSDEPTAGAKAVPNRPGRFMLALNGYLVPFEIAVDGEGRILAGATKIRLLPIALAE